MSSMGMGRTAALGRLAALVAASAIVVGACGSAATPAPTTGPTQAAASASTAASTAPSAAANACTQISVVAANYSNATAPFWQDLAQKYQAATGVTVNLQVVDWSDIHQKVTTMVQVGTPPDILNYDTFANFAKDGLLMTTDQYLDQSQISDFVPSFAASGQYDGKAYGMPLVASDWLLFYNKDLFSKAGISAPPATWEDLTADSQKISALGGGKAGFGLAFGPVEPQVDFSMFTFANGGGYQADGKWAVNSAQNLAAIQYLNDLANKYKATEVNPGKTNRVEGVWPLFTKGVVGMTLGNAGLTGRIKTDAPSLSYGLAPMPVPSGNSAVTLGIADYLMAFKNPKCDSTDAVKKFLAMFWQTDTYAGWVTSENFLPTTTSASKAMAATATGDNVAFLKALPTAQFAPVTDPCYDKVLGAIKTNIGLAVSGTDPKTVLDQIQSTATACASGG
jgi:multiple sugar transport system substrate-binding protein